MNDGAIIAGIQTVLAASPKLQFHIDPRTKLPPKRVVVADEAVFSPLLDALRNDPVLGPYLSDGIAWTLNKGFGLDAIGLARWLVKSRLEGAEPNRSLTLLRNAFERNKARCYCIVALNNVEVIESVELLPGMRLIPYAAIPQDEFKQRLIYGSPDDLNPPSWNYARAALMIDFEMSPIFFMKPPAHPNASIDQNLIEQVLLALTLAGPSAPTIRLAWFGFYDPMPLDIGPAWLLTTTNASWPSCVAIKPDEAKHVVQEFLSLDEKRKQVLRIPMERLRLSIAPGNVESQAIELGTALEVLLANEREHSESISHLVRLRAALLHGGSLEQRVQVHRLIGNVYNLRSKAVHTGKIDFKKKIKGKPPDEILKDGATECANLIRKMMQLSAPPNWCEVELLGGFSATPGPKLETRLIESGYQRAGRRPARFAP